LNHRFHGKKNTTPLDLWTNTNKKPTAANIAAGTAHAQTDLQIKERNRNEQRKELYLLEEDDIDVDDKVRVRLDVLYSSVRRKIKSGEKKLLTMTFTPWLWTVTKVSTIKNSNGKRCFTVRDDETGVVPNRTFYRDQLFLVENPDEMPDNIPTITRERMHKLNNTHPIAGWDNMENNG
jgi:hypothetical protein